MGWRVTRYLKIPKIADLTCIRFDLGSPYTAEVLAELNLSRLELSIDIKIVEIDREKPIIYH